MDMKKNIIIYRKQLLRKTETFIVSQVKNYTQFNAVLCGENYLDESYPLDDMQHQVFVEPSSSRVSSIFAKVRQRLGIVSKEVHRKLKDISPCLIHAHTGFDGVIAWPYAKKMGIPLVVSLHGQCTTTHKKDFFKGRLGFWNRFYPLQLLMLSRKKNVYFLAVSEAIKETAIAFGIPEEKISVFYSGIQLENFPMSKVPMKDRPNRVVFIARLIEFKGCTYLIDAFKNVLKHLPDSELVIIGEGPLRQELERQAAPIQSNVQFLGLRTHAEIAEILSKAKIFCLPSITLPNGNYETFGVVAVEAQAAGVPVVTSARGAKESVIDGVTGFVFSEKDVPRLSEILIELLGNPEMAEEMGKAAATHAHETFGAAVCTEKIENFYNDILKK